jgi:hypothetical protein
MEPGEKSREERASLSPIVCENLDERLKARAVLGRTRVLAAELAVACRNARMAVAQARRLCTPGAERAPAEPRTSAGAKLPTGKAGQR